MAQRYDVIVVGLGAMGSAAVCHLARRRLKVLGLDRYAPPHDLGSSHGQTRIIREAYAEHPDYVPFVQRAYELWSELEQETGFDLLLQTGGLMIGRREDSMISGVLDSARQHRLPYRELSAGEVAARFPIFRPAADMEAVWEPRAGVLFCEPAIGAHLKLAAARGAELRLNEAVLTWRADGETVEVATDQGVYSAGALILAAGAWMPKLAAELRLPLVVERQVLHWFEPREDHEGYLPRNCPVYIWQHTPNDWFYGFPIFGDGIKLAFYRVPELVDPDLVDREVQPAEVQTLREVLQQYLPAIGRHRRSKVCLYTMTPDGHFVLGPHPEHPNVVLASPCSGHGFKFSPAIGEALADLATGSTPAVDLSLFNVERFGSHRSA